MGYLLEEVREHARWTRKRTCGTTVSVQAENSGPDAQRAGGTHGTAAEFCRRAC
jgi:hypothetical protein